MIQNLSQVEVELVTCLIKKKQSSIKLKLILKEYPSKEKLYNMKKKELWKPYLKKSLSKIIMLFKKESNTLNKSFQKRKFKSFLSKKKSKDTSMFQSKSK